VAYVRGGFRADAALEGLARGSTARLEGLQDFVQSPARRARRDIIGARQNAELDLPVDGRARHAELSGEVVGGDELEIVGGSIHPVGS
jgi:hypothetical protein